MKSLHNGFEEPTRLREGIYWGHPWWSVSHWKWEFTGWSSLWLTPPDAQKVQWCLADCDEGGDVLRRGYSAIALLTSLSMYKVLIPYQYGMCCDQWLQLCLILSS